MQPNGAAIEKPLSFNGSQSAHVRLRNVVNSTYGYELEEWAYLDGYHSRETFHILTMELSENEIQLGSGTSCRMKAENVAVQDEFVTVPLDDFFGTETPIVFSQAQMFNGADPILTRLGNFSNNSFDVRLQLEEANGEHTIETIGYIAH